MNCPKCNKRDVDVYTNQLCSTGVRIEEGELVIDTTEAQEGWQSVEPEYVVCAECNYQGAPEEFGLYSGKLLKAELNRLIEESIRDNDGLGALPSNIINLVLPQGGVLIT